jgi:hypothetical protein
MLGLGRLPFALVTATSSFLTPSRLRRERKRGAEHDLRFIPIQ